MKDVTFVPNSPLTYGTKVVVCRQAASAWTEFDGKYRGCPYWSTKAMELSTINPKTKELRHEHAVPKKLFLDLLLKLKNPTAEDVERFFKAMLIGVVVTLEEERLLNSRYATVQSVNGTSAQRKA